MGVAFTQTQEKYLNDKKNMNSKGKSNCFQCGNQDHWAAECPDLEEEELGQLCTNVGTVK